jgi:flagellin-like protein
MKKISLFDVPDEDERGVSPVIGVILMVAITVILAAVIATFVLGFPDQVSENVNAGADIVIQDDGNASVTWISEGSATELNVSTSPSGGYVDDSTLSSVGDTTKVSNATEQNVTIIVTAIGSDGTETVVNKKTVTIGQS